MNLSRALKVIPSLMTAGNLVLGFLSLIAVHNGFIATAAMLVLIGMVLDAFDGRIARFVGGESAFGTQLDALADMVTFGIAPAFIMYVSILHAAGWLGMVAAIAFPVGGALRLARFNAAASSSRYFTGLPITAAGGILATLAFYRNDMGAPAVVIPLCMLALALLMISRTRYPNFKRIGFPRSAVVGVPTLALLIYIAFRFDRVVANRIVFIPLALYAAYGAVRAIRRRVHGSRREANGDSKSF